MSVQHSWTQHTLESELFDRTYNQKGRVSIQSNGYLFFMVRFLRPQTHSQRLSSLRMNSLGAPAGDLEGQIHRIIVDAKISV